MATLRLYEQFRPRTLDEVVGQEKAVRIVNSLIQRDAVGGRAFWIAGPSGCGKTTIARIIASSIADAHNVQELDASELTPAALREIEREAACYAFGSKSGRAFIVNEAHGLRRDTIRQLLVWLERLPAHVTVVFTTTRDGQEALFEDAIDAGPLLSRCLTVPVSTYGVQKPFAQRALEIAREVGLDGQPLEQYEKLAKSCKGKMREMLSRIEAGAMIAE